MKLNIQTVDDLASAATIAALAARKSQCRARIFAVVDQTAQMNLSAAAAAGVLDEVQMGTYRSGLAWIQATRAAYLNGDWPDVPPGVAELAAQF
jgi:hypothetical protein